MVYYEFWKWLKGPVDKILNPYTRLLAKLGIKPIHLTLLSIPTGVGSALLVFTHPMIAFPCVIMYFICDVSDGMLARHTNTISDFGGKLDFNIDRLIAVTFLLNYGLTYGFGFLPLIGLLVISITSLEEFGVKFHKN